MILPVALSLQRVSSLWYEQPLSPVRLDMILPLLLILAVFEIPHPNSKNQQNAAKLSEPSNILHSERTDCRFLQINQLKWVGFYFPDWLALLPISFKSRYFSYTLKMRYLLPIMSWKILRTLLKKHSLLLKIPLIWNQFLNWIIHTYIKSRTWCTVTLRTRHFTVIIDYSCWVRTWGKIKLAFFNYTYTETTIMLYNIHTTTHKKNLDVRQFHFLKNSNLPLHRITTVHFQYWFSGFHSQVILQDSGVLLDSKICQHKDRYKRNYNSYFTYSTAKS